MEQILISLPMTAAIVLQVQEKDQIVEAVDQVYFQTEAVVVEAEIAVAVVVRVAVVVAVVAVVEVVLEVETVNQEAEIVDHIEEH